jgi:hypothetical protein
VDAFNRNLPYDRFLTDQLAGDLLPSPTRSQRLATAFNRLHRQTNEGGSIEEEWRTEYVSDRVHTFGTVMLALTFECAHCHDHKFDPITQRDYYSLSAFFNSIDEYGMYNDSSHVPTPSLLLPNADQEKAMAATARDLKEKNEALTEAVRNAEVRFPDWLKKVPANANAEPPGLVARFSFDELAGTNQFANALDPTNLSTALAGNQVVEGRSGQAVRFNGDSAVTFPKIAGSLQPWEQYSVLFWLKLPETLTNGVIFHRSEGTDTGFHGTELKLEDGRLLFVIKRFWPGNALAVRSAETLPLGKWTHVALSYDGSAQTRGMLLFIDGKPVKTEVVHDHLYKSPQNGGNGISFGALFRTAGLKDGLLDELRVYERPLSEVEVSQVFDGHSLEQAWANRDSSLLKDYYLTAVDQPLKQAWADRAVAVRKYFEARNEVMETSVMEEMTKPRPAYLLARGRYDAPKTEDKRAPRSTPAVLPRFPAHATANRLGLAEWLTEPHHPLTARVAVNRYWQMLFARGLVATPENFGAQGAEPSHPELLDWLARDFIRSGWDT